MFPEAIHDAVADALRRAAAAGDLPDLGDLGFVVERPRDRSHGDWAANAALVAARAAGRAPRDVARAIVDHLAEIPHVASAAVAGPGFVNFTLADTWYHEVLAAAALGGPGFARCDDGGGSRVQVEFVSSNPNGPLHIGHGRGGIVGDVLARLLEYVGYRVEREYYYNDAGAQMDRFAASLEARYLQALGRDAEVPEDGYHGGYITGWAAELAAEAGDSLVSSSGRELRSSIRAWGLRRAMRDIEETLELAGIRFDVWFSETSLHEDGRVAAAIELLEERGHVFEADGALWFRTTEFGDEKDRVLVKSDGTHTYIAPDIAYHLDKFRRGFDRVINIWGADHHGYVPRIKASVAALGFDPGALEIVITQMVNLARSGEPLRMSTRAGEFVTFREVLDEVGADATRWYLAAVSPDTAITFDLEAAKSRSMDNPVYYLQYAHARMRSLEDFAAAEGVARGDITEADFTLLADPAERALLEQIDRVREEMRDAAGRRAVHRVAGYGTELAAAFHRFYTDCRIVTGDPALTRARLWLVEAAKSALLAVLGVLGISAPERM